MGALFLFKMVVNSHACRRDFFISRPGPGAGAFVLCARSRRYTNKPSWRAVARDKTSLFSPFSA